MNHGSKQRRRVLFCGFPILDEPVQDDFIRNGPPSHGLVHPAHRRSPALARSEAPVSSDAPKSEQDGNENNKFKQ